MEPARSSGHSAPILVIEDDDDSREAILVGLQAEGYEAFGASTGEEAIRLLQSHEVLPSVILLDLMMPGMNGWQIREALMEQADTDRIPVIYVSGLQHSLQDLQQSALRGVAALPKPIDMDALLAAVRAHRPGS